MVFPCICDRRDPIIVPTQSIIFSCGLLPRTQWDDSLCRCTRVRCLRRRGMSQDSVAAAYDTIAEQYDCLVAEDFWMRRVLWAHYMRVFRPGEHVLDVACGTGLDALFLAEHGIHMTGMDISAQMIAQLQAKAKRHGLANQIEVHVDDL